MKTYRTAQFAGCHMTAGQLAGLAEQKLSDPQHGPLAEAKLRSLRGLPDFQVVAIAAEEVTALGGVVGIDVLPMGSGAERRYHIVRGLIEQPKQLKCVELKALAARSTSRLAEPLSDHLAGIAADATVTIETELYELLAGSATPRKRKAA